MLTSLLIEVTTLYAILLENEQFASPGNEG